MLRLTDLRLPLDHTEEELKTAILAELGLREQPQELIRYSIARRGVDARKPGAIVLVYHLDVEIDHEDEALRRHQRRSRKAGPHLGPVPDTTYRLPARAPADLARRPIVIG